MDTSYGMPHTYWIKYFLHWKHFWSSSSSQAYIFKYLRFTRNNLFGDNGNSGGAISLNLRVPTMIMITFIFFFVIPDMLLATKIAQFSTWLICVFTMNAMSDAIIYILGTPKLRKIICCCPRTSNEANQNINASCVEVSV